MSVAMKLLLVLVACAALADGFSLSSSLHCLQRSSSSNKGMPLVMNARERSQLSRSSFLRVAVAGGLVLGIGQREARGAYGQFAKQDYSGTGGDSQSSLGKNDIPAAGKIDPYDNRDVAQAEYGKRRQSVDLFKEKKAETFAAKERVITGVKEGLAAKSWKQAHDLLNKELFNLRRSMNLVSTRGSRAVSAAQKGGEPDKALTKVELAEKKFLASLNKVFVSIDGEKKPVNWVVVEKKLAEAEADWKVWTELIEE